MKSLSHLLHIVAVLWLSTSWGVAGFIINPFNFAVTTSYANAGGTGDRTSSITVSQSGVNSPQYHTIGALTLINGAFSNSSWMSAGAADGEWVKFDFGSAKVINEAKWYQSASNAQGTWKFQGSNDNSSWANIESSFTLGGSTVQTITEISGNTTSYRYYRLIKVSGSTSAVPYSREIEFKISP